ncbi:MAG: ACT domain-containing protein [Acidobacteria bacterium]|jgi:hypothetical protein|nr:ACT domain-containing protein [Acidobacteriota bacterium]
MPTRLTLTLLPDRYAVCRFPPEAGLPAGWEGGPFASVTRTADELSVVCREAAAPAGARVEPGWRAFKFEGPFAFETTGILASVAGPLAEAGVGIFAVSTFDTDYVLVRAAQLEPAVRSLAAAGHHLIGT